MYNHLVDMYKQGKLLHPGQPAASFVKIAVDEIPQEIRGPTMAWDDVRIATG